MFLVYEFINQAVNQTFNDFSSSVLGMAGKELQG
jgi:hypothetical protein